MEVIEVMVKGEGELPQYATEGAAGADLRAAYHTPVILEPGHALCVPTGLALEIPEGYELQIRSRSGLALKYQVIVLNSPGTIDSDYRGEIGVILINHGRESFVIEPGMRIAQAVLAAVSRACYVRVESLMTSARGDGGFGHTGIIDLVRNYTQVT